MLIKSSLLLLFACPRILICDRGVGVAGPINFIFHNFSNCANRPTPVDLTITPRWANKSYQVMDAHFYTPIDLGDNSLAKVSAEILMREKWIHLTDVSDLLCRGMRSYLGPLRREILGSIGLAGDTCPIPKGNYHSSNVHLDFKKSRLPAFPYGMFNITLQLFQKSSKALQICLAILMENKAL